MYYYILDSHNLTLPQFEKLQIELQGLLAEFNVAGEVGRVTALRSIPDLIEVAQSRGATTLVACGSDDTFNLMLAYLKGKDFTVGFVPLHDDSYLGKILGLDSLHTAVKTIAGRRVEKLDMARVGNSYFINSAEFGLSSHTISELNVWNSFQLKGNKAIPLSVRIDNRYMIQTLVTGGAIINSRGATSSDQKIANPTDGFLDLMLIPELPRATLLKHKPDIISGLLEKTPGSTIIKCKKIELLEPKGLNISIAGRVMAKFPEVVEIIPKRLKMIVGKNRTF